MTRQLDTAPRPPSGVTLATVRCRGCGKPVGRMKVGRGSYIEIKCASCNAYTIKDTVKK